MSIESISIEADIFSESGEESSSFGFGDDLELNQFDGLPFSSRYYELLEKRKALPVCKVRSKFEDALENNQLVIVSGVAQTGSSTQVRRFTFKKTLTDISDFASHIIYHILESL